MSKATYPARTKTGIYALVGIALASNLALLIEAARNFTLPSRQSFDIVAYIDRFAQLRKDLPQDTTIGYLTDAEPNTVSTDMEFGLAQYALIPAMLARTPDQVLVMANVHTPQPPSFYESHGLELVRDYGKGVMLLRKTAR